MWKDTKVKIEDITNIRWGIDKVRGGIFPRYVYRVAFSDSIRDYEINTKEKNFYLMLVEKVCKPLFVSVVKNICYIIKNEGKYFLTDKVSVSDDGICFVDKDFLCNISEKFYLWDNINWYVNDGILFFCNKDKNSELLEGFSLLWLYNVLVLDTALSVMKEKNCKFSETYKYF
ncbi:MAG: hypothetical protein RRZ70_05440 [Synergistaceae bacterium]